MSEHNTRQADRPEPFRLRGHTYTLMVLRLIDPTAPGFFAKLSDKIAQAPGFFRHVPVILDLDGLPEPAPGFAVASFARRLLRLRLHAVGVQGGSAERRAEALAAGLPEVSGGRPATLSVPDGGGGNAGTDAHRSDRGGAGAGAGLTSTEAEPVGPVQAGALVVQEPVRSGRQVYAAGCDLVVTAPVSAGAELLADGNIHVYGPLRGRALAGLTGNTQARIFCLSLEAELLSIAGLYRVNEDLDSAVLKRPAQVSLENGFLKVAPI